MTYHMWMSVGYNRMAYCLSVIVSQPGFRLPTRGPRLALRALPGMSHARAERGLGEAPKTKKFISRFARFL